MWAANGNDKAFVAKVAGKYCVILVGAASGAAAGGAGQRWESPAVTACSACRHHHVIVTREAKTHREEQVSKQYWKTVQNERFRLFPNFLRLLRKIISSSALASLAAKNAKTILA
jgi:hypothetical protein